MCIKSVIRNFFIVIISLLVILCPARSIAQQKFTFERLNSENGLPANGIKGLQFDEKNRFLWIATESGIVRYNGHNVQTFGDISNNENLNSRIVFFENGVKGKLFGKLIDESIFTIQDNKAVFENEKIRINSQRDYVEYKYDLPKTKSKDYISTVEYRSFKIGANIYFITNDDRTQKLQKINGDLKTNLYEFKDGEQGFTFDERLFIINNFGLVNEVIQLSNGSTELNFVAKFDIPYLKNKIYNQNLRVFQDQPNDDVFILNGTVLQKLMLHNNQLKIDVVTNDIPKFEFIRQLQIDKKTGTIYLGTDNRGVIIAHPQYFKRVLPNVFVEGISTSAYAQVELSNGNIQINSGQVFGNSIIKVPLVFHRPSATSTYISSENKLYYSNFDGITEYDLNNNKRVQAPNQSFVNSNTFIEVDGVMYGFYEHGIIKRTSNGKWTEIARFKNTPYNFIIFQLQLLKDKSILAATTDGLYKYSIPKNKFDLIYRDKSNANFRSIFQLGDYYLLGTYGGGVYMYKSDTIKKVPLDQNGYLKFTHCFIKDNQNRIWASTNKGLFMAPSQSLIDFWHIGPGKIIYKYYGKLEGIDMLEMNGGCSPCAIKLKNGDFSFPGIDGLIQFNPNNLVDLDIIPKVYLDKLVVDNNIIDNNAYNSIPSKASRLSMHLGISGMLSQENIRLEYKLDDNEVWSPILIKNAILSIEKPGFGNHKVAIRSRSTYNPKWVEQVYTFNVKYPWFLNPWMYLVYLALGACLVLLYIRFKTLIYQRRQEILESEVAFKTVSLNKLNSYLQKRNQAKDHVIAIMNHDILTPLKYLHITAKNTASQITEEKIKHSINQIAATSKELEYLTSNMLNWVKFDNIETLPSPQLFDLYKLVQDLVEFVSPFKQNVDVKIINSVPEDTEILSWPDSLRVLLYNIIINAIKSTSKGQIHIHYKKHYTYFEIAVSDTGEGMSASMIHYLTTGHSKDEVELLPKYKKGNGIGYQIIRHLIKLMSIEMQIKSKENVGTIVTLKFYNSITK
ncbi:MAG: HAMP domain-containing histidine kinase [Sediminibacterium sp.]|nr:HAMP domain-containing histidine kinase [Sediminibacterium sp.]MBP6144094.1 HAMP domain-containing histidine kinase [Sediminibacterium sp.]